MPLYRLYFNRCEDFPQIWSIDEGDISTEVNVIGVKAVGRVEFTSGRAERFAEVSAREPKAWVTVDAGSLRVEEGWAVFDA
jgi:hypothetical protein